MAFADAPLPNGWFTLPPILIADGLPSSGRSATIMSRSGARDAARRPGKSARRAPDPARRARRRRTMSGNNGGRGPRTVAVVGPYGSGKTTLLESVLAITGAVQRKGSVTQKNSVGDASPEARARQMSVEVNCATTRYMDQTFTFLDCPGSIEFLQDTLNVLPGVDAAVVVCEPEQAKAQMLKPYLKRLAD